MKVCIGGTFDIIHKGHELLINKAFEIAGENGTVFIGVTKDDLIKNKKGTRSFTYRTKSIKEGIKVVWRNTKALCANFVAAKAKSCSSRGRVV